MVQDRRKHLKQRAGISEVNCPFCGVLTDEIVVTPMGKKTAFITTDCCGRDQEVEWNESLENKFGMFKEK